MTKEKKKANEPIQKEQSVVQPTKEMVERKRKLKELNALRITTKTVLPPEKAAISIDDITIFELGDIGAVKAKQKAGKTTLLKTLAATWMKGRLFRLKSELRGARILWVDSEQKLQDVKKILDDIMQLSGIDATYLDSHLKLYSVRKRSFNTLFDDLRLLVSTYKPQIVIIDGLVDFVASFNDEALSKQLISDLVVLCATYECAVIAVLHENKGGDDHNMRGHLGTMLAQKAGTVVQCSKDSNEIITISCSDSRHAAMPTWKIKYDEHGHIVSADEPQMTPAQKEAARRVKLIKQFIQDNGGSVTRKELSEELEKELGLARTRVANIITEQLKSNLYEIDGKIRIQPELGLPE